MSSNENINPVFLALLGTYAGALFMASIHGSKLAHFGPLLFDAGAIIYAFTFVVTDIVAEVFGKKSAVRIVYAGFFGLIGSLIATQVAIALPEAASWELREEYTIIISTGTRVVIACIISFILSQAIDLTVFAYLREKTKGKHLWLRNNLSTICGGGIDAVVFSTIAFYGVYPLPPIILASFLVRVIISAIDTPLVYLIVWTLRKQINSVRA